VLLAIDVDGAKASVRPVWRSKDLDNRHGGVILCDGSLYGASHFNNNAKWICLDWNTGRMMWADRGVGEGSSTLADGMLYTLNERRTVGLVRPTPTGYELVSQFKLPEGGDGPTWAHPVVCGGRLYLRHGDRLYAYGVRAGK
jgi:outer membrane protein assembly factor BamB